MTYDTLVCEIDCYLGCRCYEYYDGFTKLTCEGAGLAVMPRLHNTKHIKMMNNHIESLSLHDFPETLEASFY